MDFKLYKRGYLISKKPIVFKNTEFKLTDWASKKFNQYFIYHDPLMNFTTQKQNGVEIFILGIILDPYNKWINNAAILDRCCLLLKASESDFWDYIDTLSERFILFAKTDQLCFVIQDAAGNRSLFYTIDDSNTFLSSHSELIADIQNESISRDALEFMSQPGFKKNNNRYFPGRFTPYQNIFSLTPNTLLHVDDGKIERFFPRSESESFKVNPGLLDELEYLLKTQVQLLSEEYNLAVSLTAGIDSRLTLASCRENLQGIFAYTYVVDELTKQDSHIASLLSDKLDVPHKTWNCRKDLEEGFTGKFLKNTSLVSTSYRARIARMLLNKYPADHLHLKSNMPDIMKAHYKKKFAFLPDQSSSFIFSRLYGICNNSKFVVNAFEDFISVTQLKKEMVYNYDLYDLFYWEHRIGAYQSLSLCEWDIAQDSYILFNNREILKRMIQIPLRDRIKFRLYYRLIEHMCPEISGIKINPHKKDKISKKIFRLIRGASLRYQATFNKESNFIA